MSTKITQYGFTMGPCEVLRCFNSPRWGAVIDVQSKRQRVEIRVTPKGFLRIGKVITRKGGA